MTYRTKHHLRSCIFAMLITHDYRHLTKMKYEYSIILEVLLFEKVITVNTFKRYKNICRKIETTFYKTNYKLVSFREL